jgi:ubiquinone/menaquinone biosynthesis C-methylase UbiE
MNDYTSFAELYDLFYDDFDDDLAMYAGFAERTGGPILEIGSGTGRVALALAKKGQRVVGLDASKAMRSIAQRKIDEAVASDQVTLIAGDMRGFQIDEYFGLVIVPINTFLHNLTLEDQLATLSSIKKQLKPGGLLVMDCFNPDPAQVADDRRLIVQRSVTDRATGQTALLLLSRATDWGNQLQEITYLVDRPDAQGCIQRTVFPASFRFIFRHEMQVLLKLGGFDLKEVYGSYELDPFETGSDKMIVVASPA